MNRAWFIFYGLRLGLPRAATLSTEYGEFFDLMACSDIAAGHADQKSKMKRMSFDDFLALR